MMRSLSWWLYCWDFKLFSSYILYIQFNRLILEAKCFYSEAIRIIKLRKRARLAWTPFIWVNFNLRYISLAPNYHHHHLMFLLETFKSDIFLIDFLFSNQQVPPWVTVLIIFMVFLIILCCVYLFCRKLIRKIFKKGDKMSGLKSSVDLKSMPLLGNSFKDKVSKISLRAWKNFIIRILQVRLIIGPFFQGSAWCWTTHAKHGG